jgi:hypothetical protein
MSLMIYCRSVHISFTSSKRMNDKKVMILILITHHLLKTMLLVSVSADSIYRASR